MATLAIFNSHAGPLPISAEFESPTNGGALIEVSGSTLGGRPDSHLI